MMSLSLIFISCATNNSQVFTDPLASYDITEADADKFWSLRSDSALAFKALYSYLELAEKDSESVILATKVSRAYYYCAQFLTNDSASKDSLFIKGYEVAQASRMRNPQYYNLLFSTGNEKMAIEGMGIEYVDNLYWGLANYGRWLESKGPLVRLGQRDLVWTTLEHIHDLDSNYYYGAYYRYKGALLARDPELGTDTLSMRIAFETAIDQSPDYLGNYTFMARYYCSLVGDKDLFYRILTQVITASNDKDSPCYPENQHEKKQAELLMIRAEKENWFRL